MYSTLSDSESDSNANTVNDATLNGSESTVNAESESAAANSQSASDSKDLAVDRENRPTAQPRSLVAAGRPRASRSCAEREKTVVMTIVAATPLLSFVSLLMLCFAVAYPHWVTFSSGNGYTGLWRYCINTGQSEICYDASTSPCDYRGGCATLDGLRAVMILALIANALLLFVSGFTALFPPSPFSDGFDANFCCFRFCSRPQWARARDRNNNNRLAPLADVDDVDISVQTALQLGFGNEVISAVNNAAIGENAQLDLASNVNVNAAHMFGVNDNEIDDQPEPWTSFLPTYYPRCTQQLVSWTLVILLFSALCASAAFPSWWATHLPYDGVFKSGICAALTGISFAVAVIVSLALTIAVRRWRAFRPLPMSLLRAELLLPPPHSVAALQSVSIGAEVA